MKNQSELHNELSKRTLNWLAYRVTQRGMKWMQEFTLENGLRPDAVAFCDLIHNQYKEFVRNIADFKGFHTDYNMVKRHYTNEIARAYNEGRNIQSIRAEWAGANKALIEKYNMVANRFMFAFETKVNKSDFDSTFRYDNHSPSKKEPFVNFHFLVMPKRFEDYVQLDLLPEWYGILEQSGRGLTIKRMPVYKKMGELNFYINAYNMFFRLPETEQVEQELIIENAQKSFNF